MASPGEIQIQNITLTTSNGVLALETFFSRFNVYESIFVPNAMLDIELFDINDAITNANVLGGETVNMTFGAPGGVFATYNFIVETIADITEVGTNKGKAYNLHCVSQETMQAKTNYVQKSYNTDIGSMIQDIHKNYLQSQKPLNVEPTSGTQNILIPNYDPFQAIDLIRRRAVSQMNNSSTYLYFETWQGMNFTTMQGMQANGVVKSFYETDTVGSSIFNDTYNTIISKEIPQIASATERISYGTMNQQVSTYNVRTRSYQTNNIVMPQTSYNTPMFIAAFGSKYGRFSFIPVDTASRPFTGINTMTPPQLAYAANMSQNQIKIRVYGDCSVKAGDTINLIFPQIQNTTGMVQPDQQLSGNYLVTRLSRNCGISTEVPRYTESLECMSGNVNQQS